jgi:hypothetical protein
MRPRFVMLAAVLAGWTSMGAVAVAHGGGGHGGGGHEPSPPPTRPPGDPGPDRSHHRGAVSFPLSGAQVPEGGDPEGRANATLRLDPEMELVCLTANWHGLAGNVTGLHVHRAPEGKIGPHHIELLNDENLAGAQNRVEFCVHPEGSANTIQDVVDDPAGFYLNVHSTAFPKGAIRGQLEG